MSKISLITNFKYNTTDSKIQENLNIFLKYYKQVFKQIALPNNNYEFSIYTIEQDVVNRTNITNVVELKDTNFNFIYNRGKINKGWGYNVGASIASSSDIYIFCEYNILMDKTTIENALYGTLNGFDAYTPYMDWAKLTDAQTDYFKSNMNFNFSGTQTIVNRYLFTYKESILNCDKVMFIKKSVFDLVNGFNENIRGWGGEFEDLYFKIKSMKYGKSGTFKIYEMYLENDNTINNISLNNREYFNLVQYEYNTKSWTKADIIKYNDDYKNKIGRIDKYIGEI